MQNRGLIQEPLSSLRDASEETERRRLRRFENGVRAALEQLLSGGDHARVEQTLRALLEDDLREPTTRITAIGEVHTVRAP